MQTWGRALNVQQFGSQGGLCFQATLTLHGLSLLITDSEIPLYVPHQSPGGRRRIRGSLWDCGRSSRWISHSFDEIARMPVALKNLADVGSLGI